MKTHLLVALIGCIAALTSCTRTQYIPLERVRTVTQTLRDTVVEVILDKESSSKTVADTTSTVETRYARATATWHGNRRELEHNITTKDQPIEVQVKYVDRLIVDSVPAPYHIYIDKPVDKPTRMPLRWWEKIFFYMGLASAGGVVFWAVRKIN